MKKTFSILLMAASVALAAPQPYYTVDNSNGEAAESHNLGNIGSNGISVAVKMDAQKLKTNDGIAVPIFSLGNSSDSITIGTMFDSWYEEIDAGFMDGGKLNFSNTYAAIYLDSSYDNAAYVTLMFAYRKDGKIVEKKDGTVEVSDSAIFYFSVWDTAGNIMGEVNWLALAGREDVLYGIESFTLFNVYSDEISYAEVYDTEVTDAEGVEIFNRMINGEDESDSSGDADTTVPEPATATLSLLALAALAARRRRK